MALLEEDWQVLSGLFPADWEQLGRETGAVRRLRGFDSVNALLRALLMHVGWGWSLRETAVQAKLTGIADVSDVTLLNRLRQSEEWLRQLCQRLWKENGVNLQPALKGFPVRLLDATVVKEPGKTGGQWRIHFSLRLPNLECDHLQITSVRGKGSGEKFGRFSFHAGEVVMGDAGYCNPAGIAAVLDQHAEVCVRVNPWALPMQDPGGKPFDLVSALSALKRAGEIADWPVQVPQGDRRLSGRLCAIRKSEEAIARAQRLLTRKQQKGHGKVLAKTRDYAQHILVFTSLSKQQASAHEVLECYRLRWQIELTFKRLKSILRMGHIPKQDDQSTRAWLYGKLFLALLTQKLTRVGSTISPWGYCLP